MKMKVARFTILTAALVIGAYSFNAKAEVVLLSKPLSLEEGTARNLSGAQVDALLPWAHNSKTALVDLLEEAEDKTTKEKIALLSDGIRKVVTKTIPGTELFMRYVLNRAIYIEEILNKEVDSKSIGSADTRLRVLNTSINMAIKYYDVDTRTIMNKSKIKYAFFGVSYFTELMNLNKSIFDASAQYEIHKTIIEWLAWDLYRDQERNSYAPLITKIQAFMLKLPVGKLADVEAVNHIRKLRDFEEKLNVTAILEQFLSALPGRQLNVDDVVLVKSKTSALLRPGVIYANMSMNIPGNDLDNNLYYAVKFTNPQIGEKFMAYDNYVKRSEIFIASGCGDQFCVDEAVIERQGQEIVTIIGIDRNGNYVVRSRTAEMFNLKDRDLEKLK